jgi:polyhydroxyalkanoate synthesis regulator phasin
MLETIKKSLLTGVGLALRSKGEIEELAKEFAKQSKMDQTEAKQFLNECQQKYEAAKNGLDKKIETAIEQLLKKLDLPTRSDIQQLNQRIDELTEKLSGTDQT